MKYVVARIGEGKNVSEIIKDVNIAQAIHWLKVAWKDISKETILHCFQKCGSRNQNVTVFLEKVK